MISNRFLTLKTKSFPHFLRLFFFFQMHIFLGTYKSQKFKELRWQVRTLKEMKKNYKVV